MGVIFTILIAVGAYLYVADPFEIKPLLKILTGGSAPSTAGGTGSTVNKNPLLSPQQEQALQKIGVDPAALPSTITPEMEKCFYAKLGATRANEIKNGSEPTASDYFIARSCL